MPIDPRTVWVVGDAASASDGREASFRPEDVGEWIYFDSVEAAIAFFNQCWSEAGLTPPQD